MPPPMGPQVVHEGLHVVLTLTEPTADGIACDDSLARSAMQGRRVGFAFLSFASWCVESV